MEWHPNRGQPVSAVFWRSWDTAECLSKMECKVHPSTSCRGWFCRPFLCSLVCRGGTFVSVVCVCYWNDTEARSLCHDPIKSWPGGVKLNSARMRLCATASLLFFFPFKGQSCRKLAGAFQMTSDVFTYWSDAVRPEAFPESLRASILNLSCSPRYALNLMCKRRVHRLSSKFPQQFLFGGWTTGKVTSEGSQWASLKMN